jgi:prophage DNA circulation protein
VAALPPALPIGNAVQTVGTTQQSDSGSWYGSLWYQQLVPGSWRGVGFVLDASEGKMGRRTAMHEYPYRDTVWVEDLGRLPRRFAFQAFIVGDDCYQQRNAMVQACEQPGVGTLVHPTFGSVQCVLIDFSTIDRRERGRIVELSFQFVVAGDLTFPTSSIATGQNVLGMASAVNTASASDMSRILSGMAIVPQSAQAAIPSFSNLAVSAVSDPARALNAVNGLVGLFGRYSSGSMMTLQPASATVESALSDSVTTYHAVVEAANALSGLVGEL